MRTIYAASDDGQLICVSEEGGATMPPLTPPLPTNRLDLDGDTNAALLAQMRRPDEWYRFRLRAGVLTRDGVTVPIAGEGAAERDRKLLAAIRAKLDSDTAPTAQELRVILRFLLRRLT